MRYIKHFLLFIVLYLIFPLIGQANAEINVSARNAILIEQSTGRVLYEKNAHEIASIASITKIMTAIIAIESDTINDITRASRRAIHTEGSSIYLEQGEKMLVEDLIYGLMLRSGNDAAVAISEHVAGSVEGFVYLMNEKARWLGMTNTSFDNPHGLDSDNHFSTAYDMALLLQYAMENPLFQEISGTKSYRAKSRSYAWQNKNKLLTSLYTFCTGGKTGFTKKTGRTLSTSASKDGLNLIAVTLDAPDDWRDHIQMYEWGFNNFKLKKILDEGMQHFRITEENEDIVGLIDRDVYYPLSEEESYTIKYRTFILNNQLVNEDGKIGETIVNLDDSVLFEVPIFKVDNNLKHQGYLARVANYFKQIVGVY